MSVLKFVVPEVDEKYWPKPAGEWMVAICPTTEARTEGGLYVPESAQEFAHMDTTCAKVLAMGPEAYQRTTPLVLCEYGPYCKPGDWVIYALNQGQEVKVRVDGKPVKFMLLHASHVRALTEVPELTKTGISY